MDSITDDTFALLSKRVYDMAGTIKDIKVTLNDERIKVKGFKQVSSYPNVDANVSMSKCTSTRRFKPKPMPLALSL